jgi:glyoxylase-like metal-dependent hydrolase (beta-lactamase superfamily II)
VFVCHAIPNHFGGASDVIKLHQQMKLPKPTICKFMNQSKDELAILSMFPHLRECMQHIDKRDHFSIEESICGEQTKLRVIETPGHRSDHLSFSISNSELSQHSLFPGDMILGSRSVRMFTKKLGVDG